MKHYSYLILWILIACITLFAFEYYDLFPLIIHILAALNGSTFLLFGIDKVKAQMGAHRVPESLLYLMTFLGGAIGALAGMYAFRHKTKKISFQLIIAILILFQLGLAYLLLYMQQAPLDLY